MPLVSFRLTVGLSRRILIGLSGYTDMSFMSVLKISVEIEIEVKLLLLAI